mmetsp:Transcript_65922/g.148769  ORF Transcript_65922/g.148769 Transcript_65922/m.148769 type:complete len:232 (-) Transcript_65922:171-866(-)|eukprot:CAMPEP_0172613808 /NCGR_PEP_ID=MMETSP1068-20121228/47563_1 /TAXON_ID=35684 /ORGANISM="Pseudopedinella elastica, Strain CCMP716" /LENGTH=231 /DNA_ID=CAMNT_0013418397 /DNA_START=50 /DNA_END=745 /DNA_ORIENTATION=+
MMRTSALILSLAGLASAFVPAMTRGFRAAKPLAAIALPPLPYDYDALEPHLGKQTLEIHHDKHHAKYVSVTNEMIAGTEMEDDDVEAIIMKAHESKNQGLFNNAAQSWNHAFYWECMKSGGGGKPSGKLAEMIDRDFGSFDDFKKEFAVAGNTAFGSGWAWLNYDGKKLSVTKTIGAGNPITDGLTPVLTMDVWEHAYYLNYQNLRAKYVDTFMDSLVNWDFVAANLEKAM